MASGVVKKYTYLEVYTSKYIFVLLFSLKEIGTRYLLNQPTTLSNHTRPNHVKTTRDHIVTTTPYNEIPVGYREILYNSLCILFFSHTFYFPASGQAVVTGRCRPFSPPDLAFNFYRA